MKFIFALSVFVALFSLAYPKGNSSQIRMKILEKWRISFPALPESSKLFNDAVGMVASASNSFAQLFGLTGIKPHPDRSARIDPDLYNFIVKKANGMD